MASPKFKPYSKKSPSTQKLKLNDLKSGANSGTLAADIVFVSEEFNYSQGKYYKMAITDGEITTGCLIYKKATYGMVKNSKSISVSNFTKDEDEKLIIGDYAKLFASPCSRFKTEVTPEMKIEGEKMTHAPVISISAAVSGERERFSVEGYVQNITSNEGDNGTNNKVTLTEAPNNDDRSKTITISFWRYRGTLPSIGARVYCNDIRRTTKTAFTYYNSNDSSRIKEISMDDIEAEHLSCSIIFYSTSPNLGPMKLMVEDEEEDEIELVLSKEAERDFCINHNIVEFEDYLAKEMPLSVRCLVKHETIVEMALALV